MRIIDKIKDKFHHDKDNRNRMMTTENNREQMGVPEENADSGETDQPRNRMMDTISNEQGIDYIGAPTGDIKQNTNKNLMTHTYNNEDVEYLKKEGELPGDTEPPKNRLFDITSNGDRRDMTDTGYEAPLNSDRVL